METTAQAFGQLETWPGIRSLPTSHTTTIVLSATIWPAVTV